MRPREQRHQVAPSANDWDNYWSEQRKSEAVYGVIADFYRRRIISKSLRRAFTRYVSPGSHCLHAGSGSGEVDRTLENKWSVVGLDFSYEATLRYRQRHSTESVIVQADNFKLPFSDDKFDCVFNLGVMEHFGLDEISAMLVEFRRVLKPNGVIILFWPPVYGLSVIVLRVVHKLIMLFNKGFTPLHPREIWLIRSLKQIRRTMELLNYKDVRFRFEIRDLFTHEIIIANSGKIETQIN
jgi:ubiquinone/menaquinone biosynthesis C-methylase UbiE